jgi:hypothetical protein
MIVLMFAGFLLVKGASRYAIQDGNWSSTSIWSATLNGSGGASVPSNGDVVYIQNRAVTVTADAACYKIILETTSSSSNLNVNDGIKLNLADSLVLTGKNNGHKSALNLNNTGGLTCAALATDGNATFNGGGTITLTSTNTLPGTVFTTFTNLTISGGKTSLGVNINISGQLSVNNGSTLDANIHAIVGNTLVTSGTGTLQIQNTTAMPLPTGRIWSFDVNYNSATGGGQTVTTGIYNNLSLSGTGVKTFPTGTTTVNGILSIENGSSVNVFTGALVYGANATLQYNAGSSNRRVSTEWPASFLASGGVVVKGTGVVTLNAAKDVNKLIINAGSVLNDSIYAITGSSFIASGTGVLKTQNTTTTPLPTGRSWSFDVNYNALTGGQTVVSGIYNNLILSNANGVQFANGDLAVNGVLTTTSGGTLDLRANLLSGTLAIINNAGTIQTQNASAIPIPSGKIWNGTMAFNGSSIQTIVNGTFNNLTIDNAAGVIASADFTVNGILNLVRSNPSADKGTLHMGTYTLFRNLAEASVTGDGEVSGTVTRNHTFGISTNYQFSNRYSFIVMSNYPGSVFPTSVSFRVTLNTIPWPGLNYPVKRLYEVAQTGGAGGNGTLSLKYQDSELTAETNESILNFWSNVKGVVKEHGFCVYDVDANWISISGLNNTVVTSNLSDTKIAIAYPSVLPQTWNGHVSSDWNNANNWTPNIPVSGFSDLVIPEASTTINNPIIPATGAVCKSIIIESGGILNAENGSTITLKGAGNVWAAQPGAIFNPGTSTVVFDHQPETEVSTNSGATTFYNLTIAANSKMRAGIDSYVGILGSLTIDGKLAAATNSNTIEFKGTNQTIPKPNGFTPGYHDLIISSTGTLTFPDTLVIAGDFQNNKVDNLSVPSYTKLTAENHSQTLGGNYTSIFGTLQNANNTNAVFLQKNTGVIGNLIMDEGTVLEMGKNQLTQLEGSVSGVGKLRTGSVNDSPLPAGKTWTGMVEYYGTGQTVASGTYADLLLSNTSGINSAGGALAVNGTLTITSGGVMDMGDYTLSAGTYANNGIVRFAGASNGLAIETGTVEYTAPTGGQTVAAGTYNNLTLGNTSGTETASGDLTINGTLTTTANGALDLRANLLQGALSVINNGGTIQTQNTSLTPIPSGRIWGGTVAFNGSSVQKALNGVFNNLTVDNAAGVIATDNFTVNGILDLVKSNPSAKKGTLHMGDYTLFRNLGTATVIGVGEVSGAVTRTHTFDVNTNYKYGSRYSFIVFSNYPGSVFPTSTTIKVTLDTLPWSGLSHPVQRLYQLAQTDGATNHATISLNYQDNELIGGTEGSILEFWLYLQNKDLTEEGSSAYDKNARWISLSDVNSSVITSNLSDTKLAIAYPSVLPQTWTGSINTDWNNANNWNPIRLVSDNTALIIPNTSTTMNDPIIPVGAVCKSVTIESGGILNAAEGATLTLKGSGNVWMAERGATFNPGNSTVIFDHQPDNEVASNSGSTTFYNVVISANSKMRPGIDSYMGILGSLTINGVMGAAVNNDTIEFKGVNQSIPKPNGPTSGYHNLILNGTGNLTFPDTLIIAGDFKNNKADNLSVPSYTKLMANNRSQILGGSYTTTFGTLYNANNTNPVYFQKNIGVTGNLILDEGSVIDLGDNQFTQLGGVASGTGRLRTGNTSLMPLPEGKTWPGTVEYYGTGQTVASGAYNNLVLTNSDGINSAGGLLTVNGTLTTSSGSVLNMSGYTLSAGSYANSGIIRFSGVSNGLALETGTVEYTASAGGQIISAGTYHNLTLSNTSGVQLANGPLTVDGALSTTAGGTLNMGINPLSGPFATISNSGTIQTQNTSESPIPSNKNWGGTIEYNGAAQFPVAGTYTNLTLSGNGVKTLKSDLTAITTVITPAVGLTISSNKTLTNNGTFTLQSDSTGTATLLNSGSIAGVGTTSAQQWLPVGRNWYVTTPMSDETASTFADQSYTLWYYDAYNATWPTATDKLDPYTGLVANSGSGENRAITFTGTFNSEVPEVILYRYEESLKPKRGFNLIGNPYPSYADWQGVITTNINPSIWYRTKENTYYFASYNSLSDQGTWGVTRYLPPMQAFWVYVDDNPTKKGAVVFPNSVRRHKENGYCNLKSAQADQQVLKLQVSTGIYSDETIVVYNSNALDGLDGYDTYKMTNANNLIPEIYTLAGGQEMVINGFSSVASVSHFPLGFRTGQTNQYFLKVTGFTNFDAGTKVTLVDNVAQTLQDLTNGSVYTFSSAATNSTNRFAIVISNEYDIPLSVNQTQVNDVQVYVDEHNEIVVKQTGLTVGSAKITVTNALGQTVIMANMEDAKMILRDHLPGGVYVVSAMIADKLTTQKIIVK